MEQVEIEFLKTNLPSLIRLVNCNVTFLTNLYSKNVLTEEELDILQKLSHEGSCAQTLKLFNILFKKVGAFDILVDALSETQQSGGLGIIQNFKRQISQTTNKKSKAAKFSKPPEFLENYLKVRKKIELPFVIYSENPVVTCERIYETVPNTILHYSKESFFKSLSQTSTTPSTFQNEIAINVVICNGDLPILIEEASILNRKVVLVEDLPENETSVHTPSTKENILWKELSPIFRNEIFEKVKHLTNLEAERCRDICKQLEHQTLLQFVTEPIPEIFDKRIPNQLKYYISRKLKSRYKISDSIFLSKCNDVFLVEGIQRHSLSILVSDKPTDTSSNILRFGDRLETKYIVLESPTHIKSIVEIADGLPVHHLYWNDNHITWKFSSGSIECVQKHIDEVQVIIEEHNVVGEIENLTIDKKFICISDTPGMGKSVLLANIAAMLEKLNPTAFGSFIVLTDFVSEIKSIITESIDLHEAICEVLCKLICRADLGRQALRANKSHLHHLFLDAFDELNTTDVELGYKCLQALPTVFPETTFWITTRPHLLVELEMRLCVLGYNIKPFDKTDQVNFLMKFWNQDKNYEETRIREFADKCLETLQSNLNYNEDFAGIPLQCLLIGEVYKEEAIQYCTTPTILISSIPAFKISSIIDLYEALVRQKFKKFFEIYDNPEVNHQELEEAHVFLAVKLLFSVMSTGIEHMKHNYGNNTICCVGIMEPKPSRYHPEPQFIHRTFAEYFAAKYIYSTITSPSAINDSFAKFLYQNVFATKNSIFKIRNNKIPAKSFQNNVVCYFLDQMLRKCPSKQACKLPGTAIGTKTLTDPLIACINDNFDGLFNKVLYKSVLNSSDVSKIISTKCVILTTCRSGKSLAKIIYEKYKELHSPLSDVMLKSYNLLHISVIRGIFSLLVHLISEEGFSACVTIESFNNLLCECIKETMNDVVEVLDERKQIVDYFCKTNHGSFRRIVETNSQNHPLFSGNVHASLAIKLFSLSNKSVVIEFLQKNLKTYNCDALESILSCLFGKKLFHIAEIFDKIDEKTSLLANILQNVKITVAFLEFLKTVGVFTLGHYVDFLPKLAIKYKQDPAVVNWLVQNVKGSLDSNDLVTYLLKCRNYSSLDHLLQCKTINFSDTADWSELVCDLCRKIPSNSTNASVKSYSIFIVNIIDIALKNGASLLYTKSIAGQHCDTMLHLLLSKKVVYWDVCKFIVDRVGHQWVNKNPDYSLLSSVIDAQQDNLLKLSIYILEKQLDGISYTNFQALFLFMIRNFKPLLAFDICIWYSKKRGSNLETVLLPHNGKQISLFDLLLSRYAETLGTGSSRNEGVTNISKVFHPKILQDFDFSFDPSGEAIALSVHVCRMVLIKSDTFKFCYESRSNELSNEKHLGDRFPIYIDNFLSRVCTINGEKAGLKDLVKVLLECGADVSEQDEVGNTPLYCIAYNYNFSGEIWEMLVKAGAKLFHPDKNTKHPLIKLISRHPDKYSNLQSEILEKRAADVLFLSGTVLCNVIWNCELKTVRELCEWHTQYGEKPMNYLTGWVAGQELTCLHAALLSGNVDVLEYVNLTQDCKNILNSASKPSLVNIYTGTTYEKNVKKSKQKFVTLLKMIFPFEGMLNAENDPELEDEDYIRDKIAEYWIELGGRVDATDEKGNTLLHHILSYYEGKLLGTVSKLVKSGASVNAQNLDLETPLHKLCHELYGYKMHYAEILKLFFDNDADFTICDLKGNSVLHNYARKTSGEHDFHCAAEWFVNNGFKDLFTLQNKDCETPLQIYKERQFTWNSVSLKEETISLLHSYGITTGQ